VIDVPVTADIPREDEIFQRETVTRTRHVLGWNFHRTEFVESIVFDVLMTFQVSDCHGAWNFLEGNFGGSGR